LYVVAMNVCGGDGGGRSKVLLSVGQFSQSIEQTDPYSRFVVVEKYKVILDGSPCVQMSK